MIEPATDNGSPEDDTTNLVPAYVIEQKRQARAEHRKRIANTIVGSVTDEEVG